jgi:hypothetical protein
MSLTLDTGPRCIFVVNKDKEVLRFLTTDHVA